MEEGFAPQKLTAKRKLYHQQSIIYKYPRITQFVLVTVSLTIFFSKPLYDIFIREAPKSVDLAEPPTKRDLLKLQISNSEEKQ